MKLRSIILLMIPFLLFSCEQPYEQPHEQQQVSSLVYGTWVLKKGTVQGFLMPCKYSQTITFKENGNYKEENYNASSCIGNWKISGDCIWLNDWEGVVLATPIYVISVTENTLVLEYEGSKITYVREDNEFENLKQELVGTWEYTSGNAGWVRLNGDGTGRTFRNFWSESPNLGEGDEIDRWWLEENVLMIHHKHSSSGSYKDYEILFINDKYLGMGKEVMSLKYR